MSDRDVVGISRRRYRIYAALTLAVAFAVGFAALEFAFRQLRRAVETGHHLDRGMIVYDERLGWRASPGWRGRHTHHDFDVRYVVNVFGFRGGFDHAFDERRSRRIAVLGDSMTFGLGVAEGETFVDDLARRAARHETLLNFAVPGYSTDQQAILAESMVLPRFRATELVLVVYLANDLIDNERAVPVQGPAAKPYFQLTGQGLVLKNVPVPRGQNVGPRAGGPLASLIPADPAPPGFLARAVGGLETLRRLEIVWPPPRPLFPAAAPRVQGSVELFVALAARLQDVARRRGARLTVVLLPGRGFFASRDNHAAQYQDYIRAEIVARAGRIGVPVLDIGARWRERPGDSAALRFYHRNDGHLTADGHRAVAGLLAPALALAGGRR